MKNTVFINVLSRSGNEYYQVNFDYGESESKQLINFLKENNLLEKKWDLHKTYEFNPKTKMWIPRFDLVEVSFLSKDKINEKKEDK